MTDKVQRLQGMGDLLKQKIAKLEDIDNQLQATPNKSDSRSIAISGSGSGMVGYNIQTC
jgi:hypothetical protein